MLGVLTTHTHTHHRRHGAVGNPGHRPCLERGDGFMGVSSPNSLVYVVTHAQILHVSHTLIMEERRESMN